MDDLIERLRANGLDECDEAIIYIEALERQVKAADALAEVTPQRGQLITPELVEAVETALAAYRAAKEGGA